MEADEDADDPGNDHGDQGGLGDKPRANGCEDDAGDQAQGVIERAVPMEHKVQNIRHAANHQNHTQNGAQHAGGKLRPQQQGKAQQSVEQGRDHGVGFDALERILHSVTLRFLLYGVYLLL